MATLYTEFTPGATWPDDTGRHINAHGGGILHHDGVFYWFGEHKVAGTGGNKAQVGVHVYASTDLYNWRDAGIALAVSETPGHELERGCVLERPKVIHCAKTGKFAMWFHLELKGQGYKAARVGVAVADCPTGPFAFVRSFRPNAGRFPANVPDADRALVHDTGLLAEMAGREFPGGPDPVTSRYPIWARDFAGGQMSRDMTLFVDDDGAAYHIHASEENSTLHISRLRDDFLDTSGEYVRVFERRWHEAPAICKHAGRYWLIASDCTGWEPNAARSAVADSIWGPWTELGNPAEGVNPWTGLGPEKTFGGQSTFILALPGKPGAFIAMFDEWRPHNAVDGRYYWLPMQFGDGRFTVPWLDRWDLSRFG